MGKCSMVFKKYLGPPILFKDPKNISEYNYCIFKKFGVSPESVRISQKIAIFGKLIELQVGISFFLFRIWKNCKYELDSIFDEVSENRNYLSDSLK